MRPDELARFTPKYRIDPETGCWVWSASRSSRGYGTFTIRGRTSRAHRVSYEHHVGPIPADRVIDHLCRNRACVNPEHMEPVTIRENTMRGVGVTAQNACTARCPQGHLLMGENLLMRRQGRECRECRRAHDRVARKRARARRRGQQGEGPR